MVLYSAVRRGDCISRHGLRLCIQLKIGCYGEGVVREMSVCPSCNFGAPKGTKPFQLSKLIRVHKGYACDSGGCLFPILVEGPRLR